MPNFNVITHLMNSIWQMCSSLEILLFNCIVIIGFFKKFIILTQWIMGGNTKSVCVGGGTGAGVGAVAVKSATVLAVKGAATTAAKTGVQVAAGSIFGSAIKAQAVLGCSTATEYTLLGMTGATMAGVALIVACMGVGALIGYYVYTRLREPENGEPIIDQAISRQQVDSKTILKKAYSPDIPEFNPINITKADFKDILSLTQGAFKDCVSKVTCQSTFQVMRQPCRMKCCQHLSDKFGEKNYIQAQLSRSNRCLLCRSLADRSYIIFDQSKYNQILGLRMRLVKVYKLANAEQRQHWKSLIDSQFGPGYTKRHLENFQLSG